MKFGQGDTVEILPGHHSGIWSGEVGVIEHNVGPNVHVRFVDGCRAVFGFDQIRQSQQKLELEDA